MYCCTMIDGVCRVPVDSQLQKYGAGRGSFKSDHLFSTLYTTKSILGPFFTEHSKIMGWGRKYILAPPPTEILVPTPVSCI